jgi:signal transduction histidine kinase/HAMP domain-containing protein
MVLLLSVRQIRRSLTPLARLREGTRRLAMGEIATRVEVASRDEFADLAASFNRMAGQIGRQFDALETRRELSAILSQRRPLDEVLRACAELLAHRLDLAAAGVWTLGAEDETLELRGSVERPGVAGGTSRIRMCEAGLGWIARERSAYSTNSILEDPHLEHLEWVASERLVAFVGQPLLVEERLVGVMAGFATRPLDDMDLSGFGAAAGDIARYIGRRRVEDALHESEEQTRQLQKMEAVGQLAGGIAHDFNNLLTVILGRSRLLLRGMPPDHPHHRGIESIDETAQRAALLTRQLLAFSRKQMLAPTILDLNEIVLGMTDLLRRLIGDEIELVCKPGAAASTVKVDRGQLEQVIVNLVVNARDVMPSGGRITVETSSVGPEEPQPSGAAGAGGQVRLVVTDTGTGMDQRTKSRIFEPFFTTKEPGKGTGLGLATVYGIIRQSGGSIRVDSEPGAGSTFTISLPRVEGVAAPAEAAGTSPGRASGTLLVVGGESEVRAFIQSVPPTAPTWS